MHTHFYLRSGATVAQFRFGFLLHWCIILHQNLMTDIGFAIKCPLWNEKKKNQNIQQTSTPPLFLSKIRSAGNFSIWQKETTTSHIWTAIKFVCFYLTKIRFFEIPRFFPNFQQNFKFPDFYLQGIFFKPFSLFSRVRCHPDVEHCQFT